MKQQCSGMILFVTTLILAMISAMLLSAQMMMTGAVEMQLGIKRLHDEKKALYQKAMQILKRETLAATCQCQDLNTQSPAQLCTEKSFQYAWQQQGSHHILLIKSRHRVNMMLMLRYDLEQGLISYREIMI